MKTKPQGFCHDGAGCVSRSKKNPSSQRDVGKLGEISTHLWHVQRQPATIPLRVLTVFDLVDIHHREGSTDTSYKTYDQRFLSIETCQNLHFVMVLTKIMVRRNADQKLVNHNFKHRAFPAKKTVLKNLGATRRTSTAKLFWENSAFGL